MVYHCEFWSDEVKITQKVTGNIPSLRTKYSVPFWHLNIGDVVLLVILSARSECIYL